MAEIDLGKCVGRPVAPGVALGRAVSFDPARIQALRVQLSDLDVVQQMDSLLSTINLSNFAGRGRFGPRKLGDPLTRTLHTNFFESVERVLRQEGGGLEFALGTVLARYQGAIELAPERGAGGTLQGLTDLAEMVLATILEHRSRGAGDAMIYVAFAYSLTLAEAVSLPPGLAGLVVGEGADHEIRTAAQLLKIPAVIEVPKACEFAREGDVVRVDGGTGAIAIVARVATRVG